MIKFTAAQISHLLTLLRDAEERGEYYGNREQYWKRHAEITQRLNDSLTINEERSATGIR